MQIDGLDGSLAATDEALKIIADFLEKVKETAPEFVEQLQKNERCDVWPCTPSLVGDFEKSLSERKVPHACVCYSEKGNKDKQGQLFVVSRRKDRDKVHFIKNFLLEAKSHVTRVSLNSLMQQNINGKIHTICGVDKTYADIFLEQASRLGFKVALSENKDGSCDVHFSGRDEDRARVAIMRTIESTKSVTGRLNQSRIERQEAASNEIYNGVINAKQECYIVAPFQPDEYMHFTPEKYQYYCDGKLIDDRLRSDINFQKDVYKTINEQFISPVLISREEYEKVHNLSYKEFKDEIKKKRKPAIVLTDKENRQLEAERMARQLAEFKLSLENNELNDDFYNTAISFNAFYNREIITDKQIGQEEEMAVSNPKSLPPDIQVTIDKWEELPKEDKEYIRENVREYFQELRDTEIRIEVDYIAYEDVQESNINALVASLSEGKVTTETRSETETEREI